MRWIQKNRHSVVGKQIQIFVVTVILKKDAYFERTVMTQIKAGIDKLGIASAREDRVFIQSRITKQYLDQYNQTYSVA
jgi:type I restriction enzyme, R subunit